MLQANQQEIYRQRLTETGYHIEKSPCVLCTSLPACRLVQRKEGSIIFPGSLTCQKIAESEFTK
ncbi:MAG: hypothetical protein NTY75_01940 [Candidatus Shapirobacteria bacterium]|nr:hypothetical protein [Candidatus Shapirobacteria bacterium]